MIRLKSYWLDLETNIANRHKEIDKGLFAKVFDYGDKVIKIAVKDDAYITFIDKIKHLNNPIFPKIYSHKKYMDAWGTVFSITILEKLEEISTESSRFFNTNFDSLESIADYFSSYKSQKEAIGILQEIIECDGFNLDLHSKNVMRRGYNLVIIDPFSS